MSTIFSNEENSKGAGTRVRADYRTGIDGKLYFVAVLRCENAVEDVNVVLAIAVTNEDGAVGGGIGKLANLVGKSLDSRTAAS